MQTQATCRWRCVRPHAHPRPNAALPLRLHLSKVADTFTCESVDGCFQRGAFFAAKPRRGAGDRHAVLELANVTDRAGMLVVVGLLQDNGCGRLRAAS